MASKLTVPRPDPNRKVQPPGKLIVPRPAPKEPEPIALADADLLEDPPPPPPPTPTPTLTPPPTLLPPPPPSPPPPIFLSPLPPRPVLESLPSQYELDSIRKSSPPVLERRKMLTRYVASVVGVAWLICQVALGESALRSLFTP